MVYNLAEGKGVIIGDSVAIPEPYVTDVEFSYNKKVIIVLVLNNPINKGKYKNLYKTIVLHLTSWLKVIKYLNVKFIYFFLNNIYMHINSNNNLNILVQLK